MVHGATSKTFMHLCTILPLIFSSLFYDELVIIFLFFVYSSREWKIITDSQKKEIGLSYDDDGEFW